MIVPVQYLWEEERVDCSRELFRPHSRPRGSKQCHAKPCSAQEHFRAEWRGPPRPPGEPHSSDFKFPFAQGRRILPTKVPRSSHFQDSLLCPHFGQFGGRNRGPKGLPKWTKRPGLNCEHSAETSDNWQGSRIHGFSVEPVCPRSCHVFLDGVTEGTHIPTRMWPCLLSSWPRGWPWG